MENSENHLLDLIDEKIELGRSLAAKLEQDFIDVDGALKTKRNIDKEIKFLLKLKSKSLNGFDEADVSRKLQCTNLNFFSHLVYSLYNYDDISSISAVRKSEERSIKVDFIANDNQTWVKIIARNSESIKDEVLGRCEYGAKNILAVADEFLEVATSELNFFCTPVVVFDFLNPIDVNLELALEEKGIQLGRKFRASSSTLHRQVNTKLNIDITTMLAYVSQLSNGGSNFTFNEKLLAEQAAMERKEPIKPTLDKMFEGKELICCETAVKSFDEIIELLAGPNEKIRAAELKQRMTILPDIAQPEKIINLELSSQIKERSRKIFAFGICHEAITVSSNVGFKRAAKMKNLDIPMITHQARALTEEKQNQV